MNLNDQPRAFDPETFPGVFQTTDTGAVDLDRLDGDLVLAVATNWMIDRLHLADDDTTAPTIHAAAAALGTAVTAALDVYAVLTTERKTA